MRGVRTPLLYINSLHFFENSSCMASKYLLQIEVRSRAPIDASRAPAIAYPYGTEYNKHGKYRTVPYRDRTGTTKFSLHSRPLLT